ncbi:hypothetical protein FRC12_010324 [Ceratobasidium sp. 428]|nr:hypothetical protein FRC12_010324 [Ceratobasidium sp. 428]
MAAPVPAPVSVQPLTAPSNNLALASLCSSGSDLVADNPISIQEYRHDAPYGYHQAHPPPSNFCHHSGPIGPPPTSGYGPGSKVYSLDTIAALNIAMALLTSLAMLIIKVTSPVPPMAPAPAPPKSTPSAKLQAKARVFAKAATVSPTSITTIPAMGMLRTPAMGMLTTAVTAILPATSIK